MSETLLVTGATGKLGSLVLDELLASGKVAPSDIIATSRDASKLAAYAAKAHPEQRGADLVLSYVVNDLKRFPPGDRVYYPQIVRMQH